MKKTRLNIVYDLPLKKIELPSNTIENNKIYFVICNSHNTELMPISNDESFRIEYGLTRGMELEFYKSNKVVPRQESVNILVRPG